LDLHGFTVYIEPVNGFINELATGEISTAGIAMFMPKPGIQIFGS
jgi:hypothetical protein